MSSSFAVLVILAFVGAIVVCQGNDDAEGILAKAIKAHGGEAKVKRSAHTLKVKGTFYTDGKVIAHSGLIQAQGADCSRTETKTSARYDVSVVNGDKGWIKEGETTRAMTKKEVLDAQEDAYPDWVATLIPLSGKDFTLTRLNGEKVGDRAVVGLRVSKKGRRDVDLYFDSETWLLVKKRVTFPGPDGKEMEYVTVFENFREFDGVKTFTKWVTHRDGQKRFEFEVTEAHFVEQLPADTFAKP